MANFTESWIVCLDPESRGLMPGTKVHLSHCISCPDEFCPVKPQLFTTYFPAWIDISESPINAKIMELNRSLAKRRKFAQLYCPKKKQASDECHAWNSFCKYNLICGVHQQRTGKNFIKSLRWRKEMVFLVMYLDGTSELVSRNDFSGIDIDKVDRVYPGNYEVRVVSELVPLGEEKDRLAETVAAFKEKYSGNVVTQNGLVDFENWFENASNGESAIIPEKVLVPQKTYKVIKIKDDVPEIRLSKSAETVLPEEIAADEPENIPAQEPVKEEETQTSLFDAETENTAAEETAAEAHRRRGRRKKSEE